MNPSPEHKKKHILSYFDIRSAIMELFDIGPAVAITVLSAIAIILVGGIVFFIRSAPPSKITFITGPKDSSFYKTAVKYQKALAKNGVAVKIVESEGSIENLDNLSDDRLHIDLALVQSGILDDDEPVPDNVVSLGAVTNQPVFFFYRGATIEHIYQIKGKTVAIGDEYTGTHKIALKLLELNGIKENEHGKMPVLPSDTQLLHMDADAAAKALYAKTIDAAFIMSENIASDDLQKLMRSEDVHMMNFQKNADAYVRKVDYLNRLDIPEGGIDFEHDLPLSDLVLVGPRIELVANSKLHPALSDLILDAALTIHTRPAMFRKRGEFPVLVEQDIRISDDADRFYKSGKTLFYRHLPFRLASLANRIVVVIIPMIVVLIPVMRLIPWLFRWRNQIRIRRFYRALMQIEKHFKHETNPEKIAELHKNFSRIENLIRNMRIRPAFADQFYSLRGHVDYVRQSMDRETRV